MTSPPRKTSTTVLAVAIAAALVAAPIAYSAGRKPQPLAWAGGPVTIENLKPPAGFDRFIVSFEKGVRPTAAAMNTQLASIGQRLGVRITAARATGTGAQVISTSGKLDKDQIGQLVSELRRNPAVRAVEPNGRMFRADVPNDPLYAQQWHYQDGPGGINLPPAWDEADGDGVVVAVLDTGSTPHVDLVDQYVAGYDFISDPDSARDEDGRDDDPNDEGDWDDKYDSSWHGTHVSGTVAAATNNGIGVAGVAHGARIQPVRVLGNVGGTFEDISDAIVWASGGTIPGVPDNETPAEVINLSLGGAIACPVAMQDAIDIAVDNGSVVVVAAGNSASDAQNYSPAGCEGVVTVSATGPAGTLASYSNYGSVVSVAAPGGSGADPANTNVLSTWNNGTTVQGDDVYAWNAGTSMASPHVAGLLALMQSVAETPLTPAEAKRILENTAYAANGPIANCNADRPCGAGLVDAPLAVAVAAGDAELPPDPPPPPPPPPPTPLENNVPYALPNQAAGEDLFFVFDVPASATEVSVTLNAGTSGDSDLYTRYEARPTDALYDCRPYTSGLATERCTYPDPARGLPDPQEGQYFVRVDAWSASAGYTLVATHNGSLGGPDSPAQLDATRVLPLKGYRIRVPLEWVSGLDEVDIRFNGAVVATVDNIGHFTHTFTAPGAGPGTATYQVCNAGSTVDCSAVVQVSYTARR